MPNAPFTVKQNRVEYPMIRIPLQARGTSRITLGKKLLPLALATLLFTTIFATAQRKNHAPAEGPPPIHNGIWWQSKSVLFRDGFITGYKSGNAHGAGHATDINQFPASELIDGLDSVYKDFRNRNILVDDALLYICDQLRGIPDDKLNTELLKMRAAAAPSNVE